jgi:hypothetical protein
MSAKLEKKHRLVVNLASKQDNVLKSVRLRKGKIEACNGIAYICKEIDYSGDELLINAEDLKKCKANPKDGSVLVERADPYLFIIGDREHYPATPITGTYPNLDEWLYKEDAPVLQVTISKTQLSSILKSLSSEEEQISFSFFDTAEPIRFEVGDNTRGLLMPLKSKRRE